MMCRMAVKKITNVIYSRGSKKESPLHEMYVIACVHVFVSLRVHVQWR